MLWMDGGNIRFAHSHARKHFRYSIVVSILSTGSPSEGKDKKNGSAKAAKKEADDATTAKAPSYAKAAIKTDDKSKKADSAPASPSDDKKEKKTEGSEEKAEKKAEKESSSAAADSEKSGSDEKPKSDAKVSLIPQTLPIAPALHVSWQMQSIMDKVGR